RHRSRERTRTEVGTRFPKPQSFFERWHARNEIVPRTRHRAAFLLLGHTPAALSSTSSGVEIARRASSCRLTSRDLENRGSQPKGAKPLPAWYAIWTKSNCERLVAEQLAAKGFSPFLPEMPTRSRRNGRFHVVQLPMFPGYLFLRHEMNKSSYVEVLKARGI